MMFRLHLHVGSLPDAKPESYGGDRYRTFEAVDGDGAPPVETDITLQFKELEIITRERVFEGF